jgi:hypothetical protein
MTIDYKHIKGKNLMQLISLHVNYCSPKKKEFTSKASFGFPQGMVNEFA